ncbi:prefoldin subunit [Colletotrichum higginsianum]|nr:prefoldin subunit [Colletotrichum higginsianum]
MPSSIRIADLLLLFLITQTAQAGPVGRAERLPALTQTQRSRVLCRLGDGTRGTGWCHSKPNIRDPRWHHYRHSGRITARKNNTSRYNPFHYTCPVYSGLTVHPRIPDFAHNHVKADAPPSYLQHHFTAAAPYIWPPERVYYSQHGGFLSCFVNRHQPFVNYGISSPAGSRDNFLRPSNTLRHHNPLITLVGTQGTPNNQVPTIRTSTPAASTTVSPEVAANNLASAKTFNSLFASLTENSACAAGQIACVKGNIGLCGPDGAFAIQSCGAGTSCFALPMKTTEGVIVGCYDPEVASGILGTPASVSVPISSTAAPEAPSASGVVSEVTTTITPTIIATYTVSVGPPAVPDASFATPVPGFTTTVVVTKTVEPAPTPSSTTAEEEEEPTATSTSRRRTITSTAEEETSTSKSTRAESTTSELTTVETTQQTSRSTPTPSTTPASTSTTATGTDTDTLIVSPIPTDEPSELAAVALVTVVFGPSASRETIAGGTPKRKADPTTSASLPPGIGVPQGTPILTVFVTVTQKERETVTVTVTKD